MTIADLIGPPVRLGENGDIVDSNGLVIARSLLHKAYSYAYPENRKILQEAGLFLAAAINEKMERDLKEEAAK